MDRIDDAFFREARSQIQALNDGLIAIERDAGEAVAVHELFRVAHSLKGACRTQGLDDAGSLAHAVEDALDAIRRQEVEPTPVLVDETLAVVDQLEATIGAAAVGNDPTADVAAARSALLAALDDQRAQEMPADAEDRPAGNVQLDEEWDPSEEGLSDDVVAALEDVSEFDDIDALLEEIDDGDDDELDGWGLIEDEADVDAASPPPEPSDEAVSADEADPADETVPDDPSMFFETAKAEIDDRALGSLQADIDAVEFGEFDDDDNFTIEELIDLEPGDDPLDDEPPTDDAPPEDAPTSATEPADDPPTDSAAGEPLGVESSTDESDPIVADGELDDTNSSDSTEVSSDTPDPLAEETTGEFTFGNESTPDPEQVSDLASTPESEPTPESDAAASDSAPVDDESSSAPAEAEASSASEDAGLDSESEPGSESSVDLESDADSEWEPDSEFDIDSDLGSDPETVPDPDSVPETDLGVDLSGDLGLDDDSQGSGMDVAVDEELAAFESRFDGLFGGGGDDASEEGSVFRSAVATIEESHLDADQFATTAPPVEPDERSEFDRLQAMTVDVETADRLLNVAEELSLTHLRLEEAVGPETDPAIREEVSTLLSILTEYRRTVMDVRLMALDAAIETLPRTVRDVARSQDKEVELVVDDTDVELDRSIIDQLRDPLAHIARNAVDHGIEAPDVRETAGKPTRGTIEIRTDRVGDEVVIEVADDGRGIELGEVRDRAVAEGIVTNAEAAQLTDTETYGLLFEPGFTTTDEVTDVSGRGVGMDVVNRTISDVNGTVEVESEPGYGTTIRLTVPVSIALTEILFVEAAGQTFGIPMAVVEQITDTPPVETVEGREVVRWSDLTVVGGLPEGVDPEDDYPLVRLGSALELPGPDSAPADGGQVVWIHADPDRIAIQCDRIVASQEVVVRPYGDLLADVPGVSGSTTLGDGEAVNVLDVGSI